MDGALIRLMGGAWLARSIAVAARLGLADLLAQEPKSAAALARETGADPDILARLLRLLAACGIFSAQEDGRFALAPVSEALLSDRPDSLRYFCMLAGESYYDAWGKLFHTVMTGQSAFAQAFGTPIYDYMDCVPEAGRVYDLAMAELAQPVGQLLARRAEFGRARCVVDIGGGNGAVLRLIMAEHAHLRGICIDRPSVCERAVVGLDPELKGRLAFVPGDFFAELPAGDIYILKNVLHNWSDARCIEILANIRRSMQQESLLMVLEPFIESCDASPRNLMDSLLQAVICETGTHARSRGQLQALAGSAGLQVEEMAELPTGHGLLICRLRN